MPEGPEIRRIADQLAGAIAGQPVREAFFAFDRLKRFERRLRNREVRHVTSRGKALLIEFDNDLTMYSHNQLYGVWYTTAPGKPRTTNRVLRAAIHTDTASAWLYSASDIEVLTPAQLRRQPFLQRLGPDALDADVTTDRIAERLDDPAFSGRSLGSLYLDQGFVAGIGNYLRSEILFFAGLAPEQRPRDLSTAERRKLARLTLSITRRSYRTAGITNPPSRVNIRPRFMPLA